MIPLDSKFINPVNNRDSVVMISGAAAIARAFIEASVKSVIGYPGAPATEIIENLLPYNHWNEMRVEWGINEKNAFEVAAGVAISGVRSAFVTKNVGINVAADAIAHICYSGITAGLVIISGDDPGAYNSSIEEDTRFYASFFKILGLEVSSQQDAKEIVSGAFAISESVQLPVFIRVTNRVLYGSGKVILSGIQKEHLLTPFKNSDSRWFLGGQNSLLRRKWLYGQQKKLEIISEQYPFNIIKWGQDFSFGIITTGVSYYYVQEVLCDEMLSDKISVLHISCFNPLPVGIVEQFLKKVQSVLIVEEPDSYIEDKVVQIAYLNKYIGSIYGKKNGYLSDVDCLTPEGIKASIRVLYPSIVQAGNPDKGNKERLLLLEKVPSRQPISFCPGCPHRFSFYHLKTALGLNNSDYICVVDPGCCILGINPPFQIVDASFCMGSSISVVIGLGRKEKDKKKIAVMGDSTFFHCGISALIDARYKGEDLFLYILDNQTTAMTGGQTNPGVIEIEQKNGNKRIVIEDIVKSCGCDFMVVVDPYEVQKAGLIVQKGLMMQGLRVVIARHKCTRDWDGENYSKKTTMVIDEKKCSRCQKCFKLTGCPAISIENKNITINSMICSRCGLCKSICPSRAIIERVDQ